MSHSLDKNESTLLAVLDYDHDLQTATSETETAKPSSRPLRSWGELQVRNTGSAQGEDGQIVILDEYPFRLSAERVASDDDLPQRLTLTFRVTNWTRAYRSNVLLSSTFADEAAAEFTAFLSLVTRRRILAFVRGAVPDDKARSTEDQARLPLGAATQRNQGPRIVEPADIYRCLENLRTIDRKIARGFVLASRLYHAAVGMMYEEPELSYVLLVMCLEAISSAAYRGWRPELEGENEEGILDKEFPGWRVIPETGEQSRRLRAFLHRHLENLLKNRPVSFQKLLRFVREYIPDEYWSESADDARPTSIAETLPFHLYRTSGESVPYDLRNLERLPRDNLEEGLRAVWQRRNELVHGAKRFPESIVFGLSRLLRVETAVQMAALSETENGQPKLPIPSLLGFERLVSYTMLAYLWKHGRPGT